ncbi:hypothetical protein [Priestia aryabhattai]|uniref:hypothetical protein n=1 Tax=Priestia aryabhattai TaxID=412384 RepID=UPI001145D75E|nr:hypothetical protein [Priestia aryabhattai]
MERKIFRETLTYHMNDSPVIHQIGDVVTIKGNLTMILEIESFILENGVLMVTYIIQNMNKPVGPNEVIPFTPNYSFPVFISFYDKNDETLTNLKAGHTYNHQGYVYKVMEFTEINIEDDSIKVGFTVKPITPIHPEKLKQKRIQYKKEQVQFTVINRQRN